MQSRYRSPDPLPDGLLKRFHVLREDLVESSVRFAVLGPVRAWRDETEVDLGTPQQRLVCAVLLLRDGTLATLDELIRAVWDDEPPRTAASTIRTYISRLRRAGTPIESRSGGYALTVPAGATDLGVFRRLLATAGIAGRDGDPRAALTALTEALRLWRGTPLAGLPGDWSAAQRTRLAESRLSALADRIAVELDLGRYAEQTAELSLLVAENPLHEGFRELYMHALYGSGRQAGALATFRDVQRRLATELGVRPGPGLRTLQQRILAADPTLVHAVPEAVCRPAPARDPAPAAAPSDAVRFTLLGPVGATRAGRSLPAGTPQQRALLAALLVRPGEVVALDDLVAGVWGPAAPRGAAGLVRTYVSRLRRALGTVEIISTAGGYTVAVPADHVDLVNYRDLLSRARSLRRSGRIASSLSFFRTAEALWQGIPLEGLPGPHAASQRRLLRELRFEAELDALAAELELPDRDPRPALPRLRTLVARHPLLERPRELLMRGLTRAGHPAEARATFEAGRSLLADRLGVDPGPGLIRAAAAVNPLSTVDRRRTGLL